MPDDHPIRSGLYEVAYWNPGPRVSRTFATSQEAMGLASRLRQDGRDARLVDAYVHCGSRKRVLWGAIEDA